MPASALRLVLISLGLACLGLASAAPAEVVQKGGVRVAFDGSISPQLLPRRGLAPVAVAVGVRISTVGKKPLPQLTRISIGINRHGHLDPTGLPVCEIDDIQPATSERALEACRGSLVGSGHFSASVALSKQAAFPSEGKLLAFNGTYRGRPAILAHVFGPRPVPTSFTLPFQITRAGGSFATVLTAVLPKADDNSVTGLDLNLQRTFTFRGRRHSYASAGCPAPKGFSGASFPFAAAAVDFADGRALKSTLVRSCRARG
jgi:hypothetical protein